MRLNKSFFHRQVSDFTPDRDWRFLFGGFLILTIAVLAVSVYLYDRLDSLEVVSQARMTAISPIRLDQAGLDKAVAALEEKKNRFETLLTTPPAIVDPSH